MSMFLKNYCPNNKYQYFYNAIFDLNQSKSLDISNTIPTKARKTLTLEIYDHENLEVDFTIRPRKNLLKVQKIRRGDVWIRFPKKPNLEIPETVNNSNNISDYQKTTLFKHLLRVSKWDEIHLLKSKRMEESIFLINLISSFLSFN